MSNSTVAKVSSLFNERAEEGRKLAILAGAGISFPAPSNLPFVTPLVTPIVTELIPTLAIADQLLKAENRERRNTKDFLRFETFCEMLVKLKFDPKLELLEPLGACRAVNR